MIPSYRHNRGYASPNVTMGLVGGTLGYSLLRRFAPPTAGGEASPRTLAHFFGANIRQELAGKVVIDFGCGFGHQAVEAARHGAARVIGIDVREECLEEGRRLARREGLSDRCWFGTQASEQADAILSIDAFEHFCDPGAVLRIMAPLLKPNGQILASFGPTWYHPLGGHLFSVFPWAHLIFSEKAMIRWRSDFKSDGATRFSEVAGGLNQMTIRRFERIVDASPLRIDRLEAIPIRRLRYLSNSLTREFVTAVVRCRLLARS